MNNKELQKRYNSLQQHFSKGGLDEYYENRSGDLAIRFLAKESGIKPSELEKIVRNK